MGEFPKLTLVLGGASSGKSRFAELMIGRFEFPKSYIATATAHDKEMIDKIAAHRADRAADGWQTIEAPMDLLGAISSAPQGNILLVDCLTMWLTNMMLADETPDWNAVIDAVLARDMPTVFVSNELGLGLVPETSMGRKFRNLQGKANHAFAHRADLAVFVAAGLPMVLRGEIP